jgi:hypothetical protein
MRGKSISFYPSVLRPFNYIQGGLRSGQACSGIINTYFQSQRFKSVESADCTTLIACIAATECVIIMTDKHTRESLYLFERERQRSCAKETALPR